jgi:hypothetical protein
VLPVKADEVIVQGRVGPDGTLRMDTHPPLPTGPVEVVIRVLPADKKGGEDWWQYLQRARAELEAAGHRFRSKEEIDADIENLRAGDERIDQEYRPVDQRTRE